MNCPEPGCAGEIDPDGYCTVTGVKVTGRTTPSQATTSPVTRRDGAGSTSTTDAGGTGTSGTTRRRSAGTTGRQRLGAGLIEIPPIPEHDPAAAVLTDPLVPESKRFCASPQCGAPVGRSRSGVPGRTEGHCSQCSQLFSFQPKLSPGDRVGVGGRYELVGCLAHGGVGWIYLARDRLLEQRWVVLKGLLNTGDPDALAAALAERRFLATVEHNDIVKIFDVAEHGSDGYIVMEYIRGQSLRAILENHRAATEGAPLPAGEAIAYVLEILPALGYLHRRGLLFCDFKPDNVMQTGGSLKLIDLGGVYRMDDANSPIYGTRGFQAPEIATTGPTVPSDLFTVARTLAVLCTDFRGYQNLYEYDLPPQAEVALYQTYDSLYRFLQRATSRHPDDRFQSADEMADQLFGILREVAAREERRTTQAPSTIFTAERRGVLHRVDWKVLPALLVAADDAASGYLATLAATAVEPGALADELANAPVKSVEVLLRRAGALIEAARAPEAEALLADVEVEDEWEWRVFWYRGLLRLSLDEPAVAADAFERVYRMVPGELAPRLGLAYASEAAGRLEVAARHYDVVSRTDPSFTSASFGLARCRLALGDKEGAVAAYDRVPPASSAFVDAQVAKAETMLDASHQPVLSHVLAAADILSELPLAGELRARLAAAIFDAALPLLDGAPVTGDAPTLLGRPLTEVDIRRGLERAYRELARHAQTGEERIGLMDRANAVRPRTWW